MKLLTLSDWRIQNIDRLVDYIDGLSDKPDIIVYAGDDIDRFNEEIYNDVWVGVEDKYSKNFLKKNYFEELAKLSKKGLIAVAGNDDKPDIVNAICGKNVYNIHKKPFVFKKYVFVGIEGSTKPPGILLHSEEEVSKILNNVLEEHPNKKIIIVSHTPPYGILDIGLRFGRNHIGSTSVRNFIDDYSKQIELVLCGHVHSQGGKETIHNGVTVVNCASHDNEGEPGKICHVKLFEDSRDLKIKWNLIHEFGVEKKEIYELSQIPLVSYTRANALSEMGIKNIKQLAQSDIEWDTIKYPCFLGNVFELIKNYAEALMSNKAIIKEIHPFFKKNNNIYFFDAEYNPEGTKNGPYGIFTLGMMDENGKTKQLFLDDIKDEKKMLNDFRNWLITENPVLVSYASTSADRPQLINSFKRYNLPINELKKSFFDIYYDCIFTQSVKKQYVFLPIKGSMSVKEVSNSLGYTEPKNMKIKDGLDALVEYQQFLKQKNNQIKKCLLEYNKIDLERTRFVYNQINKLMIHQSDIKK